jgi:hypothetical protein
MVSTTHIRALVTAAVKHGDYLPAPNWREMAELHPVAFEEPLRSSFAQSPGWARLGYDDALGRALILANVASLQARYPGDGPDGLRHPDLLPEGGLAGLLTYRHAMTDYPLPTLIKACHCFAYQACEVRDYEKTWAGCFLEGLERNLVRALPGYASAPWGLEDPPEGVPEPGTHGAPVSLMSLVRS